MRVTNAALSRNYLNGLQRNRALLDKYSNQVTGQRFTKMSDDPGSAVRAMQVRRNLSRNEGYRENVKSAQSLLAAAESTMMQMNKVNQQISEKFTQAINDTNKGDARQAIIAELKALKGELISLGNSQFAGSYIFGGTNDVSAPFTVDDSGNLCYNGYEVRSITSGDPLFDDVSYIEIGQGLTFVDGQYQKIESTSAYNNAFVGLDFMGHGSENLYLMVDEMITMLENEDDGALGENNDLAGALLDRFLDGSAKTNLAVTKLGADSQFLDFTANRLEEDRLNLIERQESIEFKDSAEAIMDWKMQEYIYNAALQMGSRLLQSTLFDYID